MSGFAFTTAAERLRLEAALTQTQLAKQKWLGMAYGVNRATDPRLRAAACVMLSYIDLAGEAYLNVAP